MKLKKMNNWLKNNINHFLRNFKKKSYSSFKDNIWGFFLADMQLISKFNKVIRFLLCAIDIFSKYASVIPLKDKNGIFITNAFQCILNDSKRKPNKIWVDKRSEIYSRLMKSWLEKSDIKMYSTHNEGKSVVAERFIRTLKNKIYKHMNSIIKNLFIDKLDDIVNEYNDTYRKIKMKPIDVKNNSYISFGREVGK